MASNPAWNSESAASAPPASAASICPASINDAATPRFSAPAAQAALTPNAARLLVARGVRLVGTDTPSPESADAADLPVHHVLLGAGVPIVENLLLDDVAAGAYELIALPLRLTEADASPVRAVLVER